jgi:hypothetical protein
LACAVDPDPVIVPEAQLMELVADAPPELGAADVLLLLLSDPQAVRASAPAASREAAPPRRMLLDTMSVLLISRPRFGRLSLVSQHRTSVTLSGVGEAALPHW